MDFGAMMREALGPGRMSLRAFCRAAPRDPGFPSRVMNGLEPPSMSLAEDLDRVLKTDRFTKAYKAIQARKKPRTPASRKGVDPMLRREILRLAGASGAAMLTGSAFLPAQRSNDMFSQLGDYEAVGKHLWRVYGRVETKADVLPSVAEHLQSLHEALGQRSDPELVALHSEALQLIGEVFFDAGHSDDAISAYLLAASAAKEAQDFDRWACALARYSLVLNAEQRWTDSRELLQAAGLVANRGDSALPTRQWVASVRAEVAAAEGDVSEVERALETASTVLDLPGPVGNGGWLRFTGERLPEQRASAYLALGQYDQAETELSIALSGSVSPRRTAAVHVDRARLAAHQRDAQTARSSIEAAADIATRTRSTYVLGKLEQLAAELSSNDDPTLSELAEQINERTLHV